MEMEEFIMTIVAAYTVTAPLLSKVAVAGKRTASYNSGSGYCRYAITKELLYRVVGFNVQETEEEFVVALSSMLNWSTMRCM
jgi:hypothetical protein